MLFYSFRESISGNEQRGSSNFKSYGNGFWKSYSTGNPDPFRKRAAMFTGTVVGNAGTIQ
jgi:hypothetical protein